MGHKRVQINKTQLRLNTLEIWLCYVFTTTEGRGAQVQRTSQKNFFQDFTENGSLLKRISIINKVARKTYILILRHISNEGYYFTLRFLQKSKQRIFLYNVFYFDVIFRKQAIIDLKKKKREGKRQRIFV